MFVRNKNIFAILRRRVLDTKWSSETQNWNCHLCYKTITF